jgi:hypothetical protein
MQPSASPLQCGIENGDWSRKSSKGILSSGRWRAMGCRQRADRVRVL